MKKINLLIALIMGILIAFSATASSPVQAQEDLDTILARAAAKSFLVTLTRPELTETRDFYLAEGVTGIEGLLAQLGDVTDFEITRAAWLSPGQVYEVEAALEPGGQTIIVHTAKYNNRWQVDGVELTTPTEDGAAQTVSAVTAGPRPVAGNGSGRLVFQTSSGDDIYIINADGTGLRNVTQGIDPQLSPDGSQIVFTRWDPQYELYTINVDGTNERAWGVSRTKMKSPTWTSNGDSIVFSYQAGGRLEPDFNRISLNQLAENEIKGRNPINIPDNARGVKVENGYLEYTIPADAFWWLAQVDLQNEEYTDLGTGSRYNYAPSGHPAQPNQIIYRTDKGMGLVDIQNQSSWPVSFDDRDRGSISISPDGTKVAFTYFQDGHWEIHTINIDGSNRQRLTKTPLHVVAGATTEDNQVYVNEEGFRTMSRAQGGSMPNLSWNNAAPVWSPDGSQIAFVTDRTGQWEIWIMNADGSNQRPMFSNGALEGLNLNFAGVDERMLSWR